MIGFTHKNPLLNSFPTKVKDIQLFSKPSSPDLIAISINDDLNISVINIETLNISVIYNDIYNNDILSIFRKVNLSFIKKIHIEIMSDKNHYFGNVYFNNKIIGYLIFIKDNKLAIKYKERFCIKKIINENNEIIEIIKIIKEEMNIIKY